MTKKDSGMDRVRNINMEYYRVFYYVCKAGNITSAAEALCISQPAVSQAVRQLENALDCRLFFRTPKGVRPTREGTMLLSYVKRGIEALYEGENMIKRIKDLDTGEIRIGASDMTLQFFLLPYLEQFHEKYPKIKVTVSNGPTPETIDFLYDGRIDFGVVSTPFDIKAGIECVPVKEIQNIFIAGKKFKAELYGKKLRYESLCNYPCIFLEQYTSTRRFMDQYLAAKNIRLEPEFELATSDMIVQFAKRNLGVGCLMSEFAEEALEAEEIFRLEFEEEMPKREFCLLMSDMEYVSPAASRLIEELIKAPKQEKNPDCGDCGSTKHRAIDFHSW